MKLSGKNLTLLYIIYNFFVTRLGVRWHLERPCTLNQLRSSRQPSSEILQSEINRHQQNWFCFFFGDLRFCDANTVNGGAVVVRADMSIYKCMAYFLHFEGAHTEQYLNCVDGTLERKTRLTGSRCSELSSGRGLIFSLRLRYKKGLLSGLLTPVAASSSIISRKCSR